MTTEIRITGLATIDHVGLRKEGPEDDRTTAIDIKMTVEVGHGLLAQLLGADFDFHVRDAFWREDDSDAPKERRFLALGKCEIEEVEFDDIKALIAGHLIESCRLRKFAFKARAHAKADLIFMLSAKHPPVEFVPAVHEHLGEAVHVDLVTAQISLDLGDAASAMRRALNGAQATLEVKEAA